MACVECPPGSPPPWPGHWEVFSTVTNSRRNAAAIAALSLLVVGCGGSGAADNGEASKAAPQIVRDAAAALRGVTSFHIAGTVSTDSGPFAIDVKVAGADKLSGSVTVQGVHVDVTEVGGKIYMRGRELWQKVGGDAAAQLFDDRWVSLNVSDSSAQQLTSGLMAFASSSTFADQLAKDADKAQKGSMSTVNGQSVIAVTSPADSSTLFVATTGPAYPVRLSKTGSSGGQLDLSQFNASFSVSAPSGAIDGSALASAGQGTGSVGGAINSCLVGTWKVTSTAGTTTIGSDHVTLSGGQDEKLTINPDGSYTDDYSEAKPVTGSGGGHEYSITTIGMGSGTASTSGGQVTVKINDPSAITQTITQDGSQLGSQHPPATQTVAFACQAGSFTVTSQGITTTYAAAS
jgi:hypothetical protein